jgi:hypothetical protein
MTHPPRAAPRRQALLNSSHAYAEAKDHMGVMGVKFTGLSFDWGQMQKAKDDTVSGLTKGIEGLFKKNKVCVGVEGGGRGAVAWLVGAAGQQAGARWGRAAAGRGRGRPLRRPPGTLNTPSHPRPPTHPRTHPTNQPTAHRRRWSTSRGGAR